MVSYDGQAVVGYPFNSGDQAGSNSLEEHIQALTHVIRDGND